MKTTLKTRDITLIAFFAALACIGAVALRFGGEAVVPFSIMPLVVMLAGALLGARRGALSMLIYLLIGLLGVPVFARPPYGGPTYLLHATFGFLVGFILGAFVIGKMLESRESPSIWYYYLAMVAGVLAIYAIGLPYLYVILNFYMKVPSSFVSLIADPGKGTFALGVLFLFDLVKAAIAVAIAKPVAERVGPAYSKQ